MTHIAIQGAVGGKSVDWMEKVSEEEYRKMDTKKSHDLSSAPTFEDVRMVAPALEHYTQDVLLGNLWKRPGLSARDRSIITVAILIAHNQTIELSSQLHQALDNGVKAAEISEVITHLAFYSGWANAMSAVARAKDVFRARGIGADQLAPAGGPLLPIDKASEERRAASVEQNVGPVAAGVVQYTIDPLFHDLWLRPALAPEPRYRQRSRRHSPSRTTVGSPQPGDGQRPDEIRSFGGAHTSAFLRRLAQRFFRDTGREGCL